VSFCGGKRTVRKGGRAVAQQKRGNASRVSDPISPEEKIARSLGLLLVREMEQKTEQVTLLRAIGFEVSEVAAMLRMTENHVNVAAHQGRKKQHGKKRLKASRNGSN
jgi:DNA-directed RNA polymerase specialized sigma24 family protein